MRQEKEADDGGLTTETDAEDKIRTGHARMRRTNGSPRGARPRGPGGRTLLGHRPPDRSGSSRRLLLPAPIPTRTPAARSPRRRDPSADADPISPGSKRPAAAIEPVARKRGTDWRIGSGARAGAGGEGGDRGIAARKRARREGRGRWRL